MNAKKCNSNPGSDARQGSSQFFGEGAYRKKKCKRGLLGLLCHFLEPPLDTASEHIDFSRCGGLDPKQWLCCPSSLQRSAFGMPSVLVFLLCGSDSVVCGGRAETVRERRM